MNRIPEKLRAELAADPEYTRCSLQGYEPCDGRITWEHVFTFAGKQVQERWAIIPLCERHHGVGLYADQGTLNKRRNQWVALNRATDVELKAASKGMDFLRLRSHLNGVFESYSPPVGR